MAAGPRQTELPGGRSTVTCPEFSGHSGTAAKNNGSRPRTTQEDAIFSKLNAINFEKTPRTGSWSRSISRRCHELGVGRGQLLENAMNSKLVAFNFEKTSRTRNSWR